MLTAIQFGRKPANASPAKHTAKRIEQKKIHLRFVATESTNEPKNPFKNHGR